MTQKKIDSLTPEQEARFDEFVNKWLKIGLATGPVDLEVAKRAVGMMYKSAGLAEPTQFYVTDSPMAAIKKIQELDPSMKAQDILNDMSYGSQEAVWLSFYDYFEEVVGLDLEHKLDGLKLLSTACGFVSFYEDVVVFQHRPDVIKFDDQNRLHCETGPAILFKDGFAVYAWHGVTVPDEWIANKASLTPKIALSWANIEQRRCACEILGWDMILKNLKSKVIDKDDDPMIGELLEVNIPDVGKEKFLRVLCGTGRTFAIPVPPNMKTALDANAWTYNIEPDFLKQLEVRT